MAQELDNFREKYPGYDDIGDVELAGMLSKKYPDSYGDLPGKISTPTAQVAPTDDNIISQQLPQISDMQAITKEILDNYGAGNYSERQVAIVDQLKKRGAFDAPEFKTAGVFGDVGDLGSYALETAANVPASAAGVAGDIYTAVTSPIETAKGVGKLALGFGQKVVEAAIPGEQDFEYSKMVDQLITDMDEKYGGLDRIADTFRDDPVRVVGDIAAALSGTGGGLLKSTKYGGKLTKAGATLEPLTPLATGVKKVAEKIPQYLTFSKTPSKMYQSAAKFSTTLDEGTRKRLTEVALEKGIMPTPEGLNKLWGKIEELNSDIAKRIDESVATGETIKIDDLFKEFKTLEADASLSGKGVKKIKAIRDIENQIRESNKLMHRTGNSLTPTEAQKMKQNIYSDIRKSYESQTADPMSEKAQKSVARQTKLFLEELIPGIKEMNKKDGDYLSLMKALDRPVSRISNRDFIGIGMTAKIAAGTAIGAKAGTPALGASIGALVGVLDHPTIKAKLAIVLDKMEKQGIDPGPDARGLMNILYESKEIPND